MNKKEPQKKEYSVLIRMDMGTLTLLKQLALDNDISVSAYIRKLVKRQKLKP